MGSPVEDAELIQHNKNQEAVKNTARNSPSKITSKGKSAVGEIERLSLKESHDTSKNEAERFPPQKSLRRSTVGEMERPAFCEMERPSAQDDAACLPFPKQQRRRTIESKPSLISLCRGLSDSLRIRKRSPGKLLTGASSSNDLPALHESWTIANAINSQTEMYNRMSSARQRAEFKEDGLAFANSNPNFLKTRPKSSDVDGMRGRPPFRRAESEDLTQPYTRVLSSPNSQPRNSFSIEGSCSGKGSNKSDNNKIDENTMLSDDGEAVDGSRSESSGK